MFGISQQAAVNGLGEVPETPDVPTSDRQSGVSDVAGAALQSRFSNGDFGIQSLIEKSLTERNNALVPYGLDDPTVHFSDASGAGQMNKEQTQGQAFDELVNSVPAPGYKASTISLSAQREQEKKIAKIYKNNPQLPQLTYDDAVKEAHAQANSIDAQSASVGGEHASYPVAIAGNIAGGTAATFTKENVVQTASMLLPIPGENWKTRVASMALQQFGVSLFTQKALVNPEREAAGLDVQNNKQMLEQALISGVAGSVTQGAFEGAHASFNHYFPGSTPTAAKDVVGKLDDVETNTRTPAEMRDLVTNIKGAQIPEHAATAMAGAPLETQLDLANKILDNPSDGERAIMNAGEQELALEKAQPAGVSWDDHVNYLQDTAKAIESGDPLPEPKGALSPVQVETQSANAPRLPQGLTNAKPRYKDSPITWDSDIDKSLYITAQAKKSKADAAYRDFLKANGFDDSMIVGRGQAIRDILKDRYSVSQGENIHLEAQTHVAQQPILQPEKSPSNIFLKEKAPKGSKKSLLDFIAENGGIKDKTGDLKFMGADQYHLDKNGRAVPYKRKLIQENGLHPDTMASLAHEAGYFDELGGERPTINHLYDKMDDELRGNKTYAHDDSGLAEHANMLEQMQEEMDRAGVSPHTHTDAQIEAALQKQREEYMAQYEAEQQVIPGAEKVSDKQLAERNMEGRMKSGKNQKELDDGLFDVLGRGQGDMLDNLLNTIENSKETDIAPINNEPGTTIADAKAEIGEHQDLLDSLKTCFIG